jgi:hypothetical protein
VKSEARICPSQLLRFPLPVWIGMGFQPNSVA